MKKDKKIVKGIDRLEDPLDDVYTALTDIDKYLGEDNYFRVGASWCNAVSALQKINRLIQFMKDEGEV